MYNLLKNHVTKQLAPWVLVVISQLNCWNMFFPPDFLASHLLGANRNIVLICNPSRFSPFLDPWSVSSGPQDLVWTYPLQMAVSLVLWAPKVQKWQLVPFIFCYSHHLTQGPNRPWSWRWTMRRHSWLHRHEWTSRYFSLMELLDTFSDYMYIYCIYIII